MNTIYIFRAWFLELQQIWMYSKLSKAQIDRQATTDITGSNQKVVSSGELRKSLLLYWAKNRKVWLWNVVKSTQFDNIHTSVIILVRNGTSMHITVIITCSLVVFKVQYFRCNHRLLQCFGFVYQASLDLLLGAYSTLCFSYFTNILLNTYLILNF